MILSTQQLNKKKITFYVTIFITLFFGLIKYKNKNKPPAGFH